MSPKKQQRKKSSGPLLLIDSSDSMSVRVALIRFGKRPVSKKFLGTAFHSEKLLRSIDVVLQKSRVKPETVAGILVVEGPGSFSSLRSGAAIANTLGWSLQIPVQGITTSEYDEYVRSLKTALRSLRNRMFVPVIPQYGKAPSITVKKNLEHL